MEKKKSINWSLVNHITKGYKKYLFFAVITVIISILLSYVSPLIISFVVDYVIKGDTSSLSGVTASFIDSIGGRDFFTSHIYVCGIVIVGVALLNGLITFVRSLCVTKVSEHSAMTLRNELYDHLQNVPYDYHKHSSVGDLVQRCSSDVEIIRRFVSVQFIDIVRTVVRITAAAFILFRLNVKLTLFSMSMMPVIFIISFIYFKKVHTNFEIADEAEGKLSATLQENLTGVRVVRAFGQQKQEIEKFTERNKDNKDKYHKIMKMMSLYWGGTDMLCYIQIILSSAIAIYLASTTDEFSLGSVLLFSNYVGALTWPVRMLGRTLSDMGRATVAMQRVQEILDAPLEKEPGAALKPEIRGNITFEHVDFGYDYPDEVLKDISFKIRSGETIGILGSTGSGKSSLVQLIQRLYTCNNGHIYIDDTDINDIEYKHLRSNIGIVLQEPFLYSRTIMDNIRITDPSAPDEEVYEAAKIASVHDVIMEFDKGYDTMVGERGVTLSGGQQQRIAIARTLMKKTPILIFDDSMSAVDTETDTHIRKALRSIRGTCTTLIISHRITTLMESDRILVLDKGRLIEEGTHDELIKNGSLYSRIAEIQEATGQFQNTSEGGNE